MNKQIIRNHFPLLKEDQTEKLIYFDNAATTLKASCVIDKLTEVYSQYPMNIHRGAYLLAEKATQEYEHCREKVRSFLNASSTQEIIFTKGTTESINLVAQSFITPLLFEGSEIIISQLEHHSNIIPWKELCKAKGAILKIIPLTKQGNLDLEKFEQLITPRTCFISIPYISNTLGIINPIKTMIEIAHARGVKLLIDAAQAASHIPIDVQALDADFICFSGHKLFGPFGVGVLYAKLDLLNTMSPYQLGGGMIEKVSFEEISFAEAPYKFEAGTPSIASVIALGKAIDFIQEVGFSFILQEEEDLTQYLLSSLSQIDTIQIFGSNTKRIPLVSFVMKGIHPHDLTTFLDQKNIAIRSGHLCAQPTLSYFGVSSMSRASLSFYNTKEEIDLLIHALQEVKALL